MVIFGRLLKELRGVKILFWRVPQEVGRAWHYFVLVWHGSLRNMVSRLILWHVNIAFLRCIRLAEPKVIHVTNDWCIFFVYLQTEKKEKLEREENGENINNFLSWKCQKQWQRVFLIINKVSVYKLLTFHGFDL